MKKVNNLNILREFPLPTPREILAEMPLTTEITEHIFDARSTAEAILQRKGELGL